MAAQFIGTAIIIGLLIPAALAVVFLLLLFGIVVAPAVFAKAERAERARKILSDLLAWMPFFLAMLRCGRNPQRLSRPHRCRSEKDKPDEGKEA